MKNYLEKELLAVITGAAKGIGAALAKRFLEHNVKVIVTSRTFPFNQTKNLSEAITKQRLDLTDFNSVKQFFEWLAILDTSIHFFINNAGVGIFKPLCEFDLEELELVLKTNLTGSFLCLKYAYPFLKSANGARVINIGSIAEMCGLKNNSVYAASKLGLRAISRAINEEWQEDNIFCTHVVLGAVATDIWSDRKEFSGDDMLNVNDVAKIIVDSVINSKNIRLDTLEILPKKGVL